jgi:hypothetical protein
VIWLAAPVQLPAVLMLMLNLADVNASRGIVHA